MKTKSIRLISLLLLVVMCLTSFPVTAFAYAEDPDPEDIVNEEVTEPMPEPTDPEPEVPTTGGIPLTPDGNMTLVDDIEGEATEDKQFITVVSKSRNYFYIIIDRADDGENTVHFLNQVDEADLLALMEDGETAAKPVVCSCTEKCQAGAVKTECAICMANMSECGGKEPVAQEPTEPEEPEAKGGAGAILAVVLILAAGGGAAYYFLVMKPRQGGKVPSDLDDLDLEDEEYYEAHLEDECCDCGCCACEEECEPCCCGNCDDCAPEEEVQE